MGDHLDRLHRSPDLPESECLGNRCLCRDDGECLTYVLNLAHPPGPRVRAGSSHAASSIEAIWIATGELGALEAGRLIDRFLQRIDAGGGEWKRIAVCLEQDTPDPALLRLVKSRFRDVRCGVSGQEFLQPPGNNPTEDAPAAALPSPGSPGSI